MSTRVRPYKYTKQLKIPPIRKPITFSELA